MNTDTASESSVAGLVRDAAKRISSAYAFDTPVSAYTLRLDQESVFRDLADYVSSVSEKEDDAETPMGRIILPPRLGKTVIAGQAIASMRIPTVFITTTLALVDQCAQEFRAMLESTPVGVYTGETKNLVSDGVNITTYSILQREFDVHGALPDEIRCSALVFIDEGHHSMTAKRQKLLKRGFDPQSLRIALTATPDYNENRALGKYFPILIHEVSMAEAVQLDLLAPVRVWLYGVDADASHVRLFAGDYEEAALAALMSTAPFFRATELLRFAEENISKQALLCCKTRQQAYDLLTFLAQKRPEESPKIRLVVGETPKEERRDILAAFERGEIHTLIAVGILVEGWSSQSCKLLIDLSPSLSRVRATQKFFRPMTKWGEEVAHIYVLVPDGLSVPPILPTELLNWGRDDYEAGSLIASPAVKKKGPQRPRKVTPIGNAIKEVRLRTRIITHLRFEKPKLDPRNWTQIRKVIFSNPSFQQPADHIPGLRAFRWLFFRHDLFTGRGAQLLRYLGIRWDYEAFCWFLMGIFPESQIEYWPSNVRDVAAFKKTLTRERQRNTSPQRPDISLAAGYLGSAETPTPEELLILREKYEAVFPKGKLFGNDLSPMEYRVLSLRFGLGDEEPHTLEEIGEEYVLSRTRIQQIQERALRKLQKHIARIFPKFS